VFLDDFVELSIVVLDSGLFFLVDLESVADCAVELLLFFGKQAHDSFEFFQKVVDLFFPRVDLHRFPSVDPVDGESLTGQQNCTFFTVVQSLLFAVDHELGSFVGVIDAHRLSPATAEVDSAGNTGLGASRTKGRKGGLWPHSSGSVAQVGTVSIS
jgi:hypothetical protein